MNNQNPSSVSFPVLIESPSGLRVEVNANGSIKRMDHRDIILNLFLGTEVEGGPANIYLRRHGNTIESIPLLGPRSPAAVHVDTQGVTACGAWQGIRFCLNLVLAREASAWFWHVELENTGTQGETVDLIYTQDLALAHYGAVRLNEYYVSHYIDHTALPHARQGVVLASRQNLSMGGHYPWTLIGSLERGVSYATDALQFHGLATRAGLPPVGLTQGLPGSRRQHEHSMAAIQDAPVVLHPGARAARGFFGWFEPDKQTATTEADLAFIDKVRALPEALPAQNTDKAAGARPASSLFSTAPILDAMELTDKEITELFGAERRNEEYEDGKLLSFFVSDHRHVVLKAKELQVLRPHGHMLRTGSQLTPDEASLTTTTWMAGVFHSMVTQGHVSINRFLSTCHSYLGLFRSNGQRVFVEIDGTWHLLDVPSAYEMAPGECRWLYKYNGGLIAVRSSAQADCHELSLSVDVLSGPGMRFLVAHHVSIGGDDGNNPAQLRYTQEGQGVFIHSLPDCDVGWRFPDGGFRIDAAAGTVIEKLGGDELLFSDNAARNQPFLCIITRPSVSIAFSITGCLIAEEKATADRPTTERFWNDITAALSVTPPAESPAADAAARIAEILPWFVNNALIHYLSPRGLEQYSGGGWGTRDVSQGPVEMLLALGRFEPVRDILIRVFRQQNPDGDWPQWFMFFDRERNIRPGDSHGDIVFWPVLALSQYLSASGDGGLLDETLPFFHPEGDQKAERVTVWGHVERALALMEKRVIPSTRLAAYGNGDWNDSLQPVQPAMREHLCSSWTVTLHYQTLLALAGALRQTGRTAGADKLESAAEKIREDFRRILIVDGTIAGFGYFHDDGKVEYLLHPHDKTTGLSYSLLPMMHAVINDLVTPEQASRNLGLIREHLLGPDGARLFDRPMEYHGGMQKYFQRAETTTFFGRENGLMYTHAHLRYAETLAHYGDAEGFFKALRQAIPIGIKDIVPTATLRQANCYYSSSDPAFSDRYVAFTEYERVKKSTVDFEGGWRVYSSGAGICVRLIMQNFFGVRWETALLKLDPVMPKALDGLRATLTLAGHQFEITYRIEKHGFGPTKVLLNDAELAFTRGSNPYRTGAAKIPMSAVQAGLTEGVNRLTVWLG